MLKRLAEKNLTAWMPGYLRHLAGSLPTRFRQGHKHLLFAFCDHFEPHWRRPGSDRASARVRAWSERYPPLAQLFRDSTGRHPRHSFFFPGEEYEPEFLDRLAVLARAGLGEVELHLHHDQDTSAGFRQKILDYLATFSRHGHLTRENDRLRYAFIHGNWCLANARRDGRMCGVNDELSVLFETGCYADFTFPSAPDESQPGIVNRIYWPTGDLRRARAYETGEAARVGHQHRDRILIVEGPLALSRRPGRLSLRIENGAVTAADPPSIQRVRSWVGRGIHITGRPEWVFVKVHTHGASETQAESLLGAGGHALHQILATHFNDGVNHSLHYVTAREMYNVAWAAMDGRCGNPADYYDYCLPPPPAAVC